MNIDLQLSIGGLLITVLGAMHYFSKVRKNQTPEVPVAFVTSLIVGSIMGIAAIFHISLSIPVSVLVSLPIAMLPIIMTVLVYITLKGSKAPLGDIKIEVGDQLPNFSTTTYFGTRFNNNELDGKRVFLKFYRGSWCPYCSTELKMFEDMKPMFDEFDVKVVAVSNDSPQHAMMHKKRDKLTHTLLSDVDLSMIRAFGVEHHKALGGDSEGVMTVFGLPFPKKMQFKPMAIPTSILVDEHGIVQWIDQSDDVRIRANEERVTAALRNAFEN
ncbi:peroxiredoxin family protein [Vibrio sp. 1CM24A]|jgi:peroxiredoxin|uniref:peroxiredoxin family protein n=1 Tax=Vibrio sp. 1CM24A TaxID=2929165 RepID=UPI0020C095DC|nr:peroxiredoxin family protein [Vibrio sp. 1CM24A]MCK8083655.1 peroxiredoxin family protein [Vibrio sp. 1CM24A]